MSLSGKLEVFALEEVLRLLARSHQNGCLRVDGAGSGRIYLDGGSVTLASVESDDALRGHLVASGIATDEALSRVDVGRGTLSEALTPTVATSTLADVIREQTVEAVYRIRRPLTGAFTFEVDGRPRYATGQSFDVETIISEADRRASDWADIETVVPDLAVSWRMVPSIEDESVNLSDTAWRFLAALDGSCSVNSLASRLGMTTFQTARRVAELSRARLVEQVVTSAPQATTYEEPSVPLYSAVESAIEPALTTPVVDAPAAETSWWAGETTPVETFESEPVAPFGEVDDHDESFLESVFAELDKDEEPEVPASGLEPEVSSDEKDDTTTDDDNDQGTPEEGGFGLLRRRGLGAAFRELADS